VFYFVVYVPFRFSYPPVICVDTPFKQQRLASWQPVLTPIKVILIFIVIGIIFIPVGTTLMGEAESVSIVVCFSPSQCASQMFLVGFNCRFTIRP
jgi:hypothetical protein